METTDHKKEIYRYWAKNISGSSVKEIKDYKNKVIIPFFPADKSTSILELGSGSGNFLAACHEQGYKNIKGIELMAELAQVGGRENVEIGDFQILLKGQSDIICAFDVLEHFERSQILDILKKIYGALNPGGMFIFRAPNAESPKGAYIMHSDLTHETMFTGYLINEILNLVGFKNIEVLPWNKPEGIINNLLQRLIARAFGLNRQMLFSGNLLAVAKKN